MLELKKKKRSVITPLKAGIIAVFIIIFWLGLQLVLPALMDTVYFKFFLLCFLGFGFMVISFLLKYG